VDKVLVGVVCSVGSCADVWGSTMFAVVTAGGQHRIVTHRDSYTECDVEDDFGDDLGDDLEGDLEGDIEGEVKGEEVGTPGHRTSDMISSRPHKLTGTEAYGDVNAWARSTIEIGV
jgi:hypothetical protein